MMKIIGDFGMIAKREIPSHRSWLALLSGYLISPFYLPLQVVSAYSVEWDGWLRIGGLLLQLTVLTSARRFAINSLKSDDF